MTRKAPARILITGFGPFPGVPHNVSSELAERCAKAWSKRPDMDVTYLSLATDWQTARTAAAAQLTQTSPDIVIHLGVSEKAQGLVLETHAYNECCSSPDVDGKTVSETNLDATGPQHVTSTAPIQKIANRLAALGHPVSISDDPGRYLCNAVYHETLSRCGDAPESPVVIFIHIPIETADSTATKEDILSGLDSVATTLMEY